MFIWMILGVAPLISSEIKDVNMIVIEIILVCWYFNYGDILIPWSLILYHRNFYWPIYKEFSQD